MRHSIPTAFLSLICWEKNIDLNWESNPRPLNLQASAKNYYAMQILVQRRLKISLFKGFCENPPFYFCFEITFYIELSHLISKSLTTWYSWNYGLRLRPKSFQLVWRCQQLLSGILANGQLPQVLCQSRLSINDKGDDEVKPRTVDKYPGICLTVEKNPEISVRGPPDEVWKTSKRSNGVPYFKMTLIGSHRSSGRSKKGIKKGVVK